MQKRFFYIAFVLFFGSASVIVSAQEAQQMNRSQALLDAHNADDAIERAQTLPSREEKVEYLTKEAQRLLGMNQYEEAQRISSFILTTYDPENKEARRILERAQAESIEKETPEPLQNPSPEEQEKMKREMWDERTQNHPVNLG